MVKKLDKQPVQRKITKKIWVGDVPVGGGSPVSVQSMTNTETLDVSATVSQIKEFGFVSRGWLGVAVQEVTKDLADSFGLDVPRGALIGSVLEGSPAEKAGYKTEYYNQKRLARARMLTFNKQEALQTIRKPFKQSPKI